MSNHDSRNTRVYSGSIKICAFSDTHTKHSGVVLPDADVLVFAGDLMSSGHRIGEMIPFLKWMGAQPHQNKLLIAGNHDRWFEYTGADTMRKLLATYGITYLYRETTNIDGVTFYGDPYTPEFNGWAFQIPRDELTLYWGNLPKVDVLVTHGPPYEICDGYAMPVEGTVGIPQHLGDPELLAKVKETMPVVHIFGHIHEGHGTATMNHGGGCRTEFHNVAICDGQYRPVNKPHIIEI